MFPRSSMTRVLARLDGEALQPRNLDRERLGGLIERQLVAVDLEAVGRGDGERDRL
jgi:hypothetical protein